MPELDRKTNAILKIVSSSREPVGSAVIAKKLKQQGIDMSERTVRYHLKQLNEQGLTKVFWKEGRMITRKGMEEISNALVFDKVGMISARIESLAYQMDFDLEKKAGNVILNVSFFHKGEFEKALAIMAEVFNKKLSMGELVMVVKEGKEIGGLVVPEGEIAFGTLCSINHDGILLKHAIPLSARLGGIMQMEGGRPLRFTEIIEYTGSTLDPHEIFLRSRMTRVHEGKKILAGMREIPAASKDEAEAIIRRAGAAGLGGALMIGQPGQPILGIPVGEGRVGVVFPGGLNPVAACEECGIETESKALVTLVDYKQLNNFHAII